MPATRNLRLALAQLLPLWESRDRSMQPHGNWAQRGLRGRADTVATLLRTAASLGDAITRGANANDANLLILIYLPNTVSTIAADSIPLKI